MKRNERTAYNQLKKTVTNDTLYVEIPTNWTHEARQAIHELLTIEKGMYASCIGPEVITGAECVRYAKTTEHTENTRREQENTDIDAVSANLAKTEYAWNGYKHNAKDADNGTKKEEANNEHPQKCTVGHPDRSEVGEAEQVALYGRCERVQQGRVNGKESVKDGSKSTQGI